jgi:ribonuclease BN (tRNA processing enzyme)
VELTVLGASGSFSTPESACSGYLLREDGFALWVDTGNGTLGELQRHISRDQIGAIFLSHSHPDHCADIYPYLFSMLSDQVVRKTPVLAPPRTRERLESLLGDDSRAMLASLMDWQEVKPGDMTEAGPFRLEMFDAAHSTANNTLRAQTGGRTFCYSGDTGPNEHLARAAADADLFLCEATWLDDQQALLGPIHMTAGEAGEAARISGSARLMITHIWPTNSAATARAQAEATFGSPVEMAIETGTTRI